MTALYDAAVAGLTGRPDRLVLDLAGVRSGTATGVSVLHAVTDHARRIGVLPVAVAPTSRLRRRLTDMAACGLRVVDAVPAMGHPAGPEEAARVSDSSRPCATDWGAAGWRIEDLLDRYGTALLRGDAVTASRCHTEPTFVAEAGTVLPIASQEEMQGLLSVLGRTYRRAGLVSARHAVETVAAHDEQYCQATVLWCHGGIDERTRIHARYRYLLQQTHEGLAPARPAGLRIHTVTLIDCPRPATRPGER